MTHIHGILAFLSEEILDVARQPRLVLMLILGPFLILLLFGVGFTGQQAPVETIVVLPEGTEVPEEMTEEGWNFGEQFPLAAVTREEGWAREQLRRGRVDLVIVVPPDPYETLQSGQQIRIRTLIDAIDPIRRDYETFVVDSFVRIFNRRLIERAATRGQEASEELRSFTEESLQTLDQVEQQIEAGDLDESETEIDQLIGDVTQTALLLERAEYLLLGLPAVVGQEATEERVQELRDNRSQLLELRSNLQSLQQELRTGDSTIDSVRTDLDDARSQLQDMNQRAEQFQQIPPNVIAEPLVAEVENTATFEPTYVDFYAPAALALLLQHVAVTLAAMSLIRDRLQGINEMYAVSPIGPVEILFGKFLSYMLLSSAIGLILALLIQYSLGIPFYGDRVQFIVLLFFVTAASLAWGFLISAVSQRLSQAVQLSMIMLLASVFFSGFFLNLSGLRSFVLPISFALPVTYGISGFQRILLAGGAIPQWHFAALAGMTIVLILLAWLIYRRQFRLA